MRIDMSSPARVSADALRFGSHGAERIGGALDSATLRGIREVLVEQPPDQAGVRLFGVAGLDDYLDSEGVIGALAASALNGPPRPVRAILFDKTAAANWSLAWHQDRVVAVRDRIDVEGFGPWSRKHGALHVAPPFEILAAMTTLRVHLDPVPDANAPLLIAAGSHIFGRIVEKNVPRVVDQCGVTACLADAGDVWMYATPILHASGRALAPAHRRVLQVDFACGDLPGGLQWLGV